MAALFSLGVVVATLAALDLACTMILEPSAPRRGPEARVNQDDRLLDESIACWLPMFTWRFVCEWGMPL